MKYLSQRSCDWASEIVDWRSEIGSNGIVSDNFPHTNIFPSTVPPFSQTITNYRLSIINYQLPIDIDSIHCRSGVCDHGKQIKFEVLTISTNRQKLFRTADYLGSLYILGTIYIYILYIRWSSRSHLDTLRLQLVLLRAARQNQRRCLGCLGHDIRT